MRVLIVDDSGSTRVLLKALFAKLVPDVELFRARNGEVALEVIEKEQDFDLITIDMMMPGINGFELAERLKERGSKAELALISGNDDKKTKARAKELGMTYMSKPITQDKLQETFKIG